MKRAFYTALLCGVLAASGCGIMKAMTQPYDTVDATGQVVHHEAGLSQMAADAGAAGHTVIDSAAKGDWTGTILGTIALVFTAGKTIMRVANDISAGKEAAKKTGVA